MHIYTGVVIVFSSK